MHSVEFNDLYVEFEELDGFITKISIQPKNKRSLNGTDLRLIRVGVLLRLVNSSKKPKKATSKQWREQLAADLIKQFPYESKAKLVSEALDITYQSAANLLVKARKAGILIDQFSWIYLDGSFSFIRAYWNWVWAYRSCSIQILEA